MKKMNKFLMLSLMSLSLVLSGCNVSKPDFNKPSDNTDQNNNDNNNDNDNGDNGSDNGSGNESGGSGDNGNTNPDSGSGDSGENENGGSGDNTEIDPTLKDDEIKVQFSNVTYNSFDYKVVGGKRVKFDLISIFKEFKNSFAITSTKDSQGTLTDLESGTRYAINVNYKIDGILYNDDKSFSVKTKDDPSSPIQFEMIEQLAKTTYYKINAKAGTNLDTFKVELYDEYNSLHAINNSLEGYLANTNINLDNIVVIASIEVNFITYKVKEYINLKTNKVNVPELAMLDKDFDTNALILENIFPLNNDSKYHLELASYELYYDSTHDLVSKNNYKFEKLDENKYKISNLEPETMYELEYVFDIVINNTSIKETIKNTLDININRFRPIRIFTRSNDELFVLRDFEDYRSISVYDDENHLKVDDVSIAENRAVSNLDPNKTYSIVFNCFNEKEIRHVCPSNCYEENVVSIDRIEPHNVELKVKEHFDVDYETVYETKSIKMIDLDNNDEVFVTNKIDTKLVVSNLIADHNYNLVFDYDFTIDGKITSVTKEHAFKTNKEDNFEPHFKYLSLEHQHYFDIYYSFDENCLDSNYKLKLIDISCFENGIKIDADKSLEGHFRGKLFENMDFCNYQITITYEILKSGQKINTNTKTINLYEAPFFTIRNDLFILRPKNGIIECRGDYNSDQKYKFLQLRSYEYNYETPENIIDGNYFKVPYSSDGLIILELYGRNKETENWRLVNKITFFGIGF